MERYITGTTIKTLREKCGMTQAQLGEILGVTHKAVSKWETAKGLPDITLIEPLAKALGVSVPELLSGEPIINRNLSANVLRSKFYVCPICGNIFSSGKTDDFIGKGIFACDHERRIPDDPEYFDIERGRRIFEKIVNAFDFFSAFFSGVENAAQNFHAFAVFGNIAALEHGSFDIAFFKSCFNIRIYEVVGDDESRFQRKNTLNMRVCKFSGIRQECCF